MSFIYDSPWYMYNIAENFGGSNFGEFNFGAQRLAHVLLYSNRQRPTATRTTHAQLSDLKRQLSELLGSWHPNFSSPNFLLIIYSGNACAHICMTCKIMHACHSN